MTGAEKLKKIRDELRQTFLERADLIDGALAALLSSNHVLVIGPPGTAKSMLADELCRRIEGADYFQWLLTRFTTPEEIFGAVSLKALEQDDYRRVTSRNFAELTEMQKQVRDVSVPSHVYRSIADIRRELNKKSIQASDRRYRQSISLLQAHAYLEGEKEVHEKDLFFLEHVLWRDPGEHEQVRNTIRELILGYEEEITELLYESREIRDSAQRPWETSDEQARALIEFHTKLRNILVKVDQIIEKAKRLGRAVDRVGSVRQEIEQIQKEMLERF